MRSQPLRKLSNAGSVDERQARALHAEMAPPRSCGVLGSGSTAHVLYALWVEFAGRYGHRIATYSDPKSITSLPCAPKRCPTVRNPSAVTVPARVLLATGSCGTIPHDSAFAVSREAPRISAISRCSYQRVADLARDAAS